MIEVQSAMWKHTIGRKKMKGVARDILGCPRLLLKTNVRPMNVYAKYKGMGLERSFGCEKGISESPVIAGDKRPEANRSLLRLVD